MDAALSGPDDAIARAIARAAAKARPAMAANFVHPAWTMSADEFRAFWGGTRLAGMCTVGPTTWPHVAPVEVALHGDRFLAPAFSNSVRAADARKNPRVALIAWDDAWHAAIVYGKVVDFTGGGVSIAPTRIYAIRAPEGHRESRAP